MKIRRVILLTMLSALATSAGDQPGLSDDKDIIDSLVMRDNVTFSEIEDSGWKVWEVNGSRAETLDVDNIRIFDVNTTIMQKNGDPILVITKAADINRISREIQTEFYVEIISGDRYITGTGMRVDPGKRTLKLLKDVQILLTRRAGDLDLGILN